MKRYILGNKTCKRRFKVRILTDAELDAVTNTDEEYDDWDRRFYEKFGDWGNKRYTIEEFDALMEEMMKFE